MRLPLQKDIYQKSRHFCTMLFSTHPQVYIRTFQELDAIFGLNTGAKILTTSVLDNIWLVI